MNGGKITFGVGFDVDPSGLNNLKQSFKELKQLTPTDLLKINPSFEGDMKKAKSAWGEIQSTVVRVDHAIDEAFNTDLGVLNINKLNASLERIGVDKIRNSFANAGVAGQRAFNGIAEKALTTNVRLRETETILDSMGKTMMNTIKWGMTSGIWNNFTNGAQQAYGYVKHLDSSLNDIRIVTGKSAEEMDKFAEKANKAAKTLGASTTDYTEASLIYYQQGLSDEETAARAETTIKAANVTGQSGEAVSEQLTAVWNGYKVSAEEAELYIDKLAAVAATTASDLEELSTGMSKVASAAAIMGVDIDQLNAQLATIVSVTREAPESIGTALKTVYARMSDITAGLDGEVSLDEYTQQMEAMGIHVLDANGNLRDMGDVIEEIGGKWQSMSREQQTSLAQTIAGTRQYSRMMALFDNWDMYTKALETSANAAGTLNEQNEIYLDSAEAHLKQLRTTTEDLYHSLLDADTIKDVADIFTFLIDKVDMFVDAIGGGSGALAGLGMIITKLFSKQIAQGIEPLITNIQGLKQNAEQLKAVMQNVNTFATGEGYTTKATEAMRAAQLEISKYWNVMSAEEINASQAAIREIGRITQMKEEWEAATKAAKEYMMTHAPSKGGRSKDEQGNIINKAAQKDLAKADYSRGWAGIEEDIAAGGEKGKTAQRVKDTYEMQTAAAEKLLKTEKEIEQIISKKVNAQSKLSGLLDIENDNIQEQSQLIEDIKTDLKEAKETGLINEDEYDYAVQKANELLKKLQDAKKALEDNPNLSVKDLGIDKEAMDEVVSEMFGAVNQGSESLQDFNNRMNDSSKASLELSAAQDKLNISVLKTRQTIANITKAINTFSNVAMGLNAISGIFDIWSNEDASTFEKIVSTMMSLSMVVPLLTTAYSGLTVVMNAINIAQGKYVSIAGKMVAADTAQAFAINIAKKAKNDEALASQILSDRITEETLERIRNTGAVNAETAALIANNAARKGNKDSINLLDGATDDGGAGKLVNNIKSIPDKIKEIPSKIKGIGSAIKGAWGGLALGAKVAIVAAGAVTVAAIGAAIAYGKWQKKQEETARQAQVAAKASHEQAQALQEEKNKVDELVSSYDDLYKQYQNQELSLSSLKEKVAELAKEYGFLDLAVKAATMSEEELNATMKQLQEEKNDEVITATEEDIDNQANAISADIWANQIKGAERDKVDGKKAIDLGGKSDTNDIANILEDYSIDILDNSGHIDLKQFSQALAEDGDALIQALEENGSETAMRLIELANTQSENMQAAAESVLQQQEAQWNNIGLEYYNGEIKDTEDFQSTTEIMAQEALDQGLYDTYDEALAAAEQYVAQLDPLAAKIAGYKQVISDAVTPPETVEVWRETMNTAKDSIQRTMDASHMSIDELIAEYGNLETAMQSFGIPDEEIENAMAGLKQYQNLMEDTSLTYQDLYNTGENPLAGTWAEGVSEEDINTAIQYGLDTGKSDLYGYFTAEDWDAIFNLDTAEERLAKIDEISQSYLDKFRENFGSTHAETYNQNALDLLSQSDYINAGNIEGLESYESLMGNASLIKQTFPELTSAMETLADTSKAGTEEWNEALLEVQQTMASIKEDADGIYTKEEAENDKLTETTLTKQRNQGIISQEEYQQKFQGAMNYELEELGIDQEEFDAYTEAVEDLTEQYELSDEMVQRIAKDNLKLQKTVDTLASDWEEYGDVLKSGDKTNIKYAQGMGKIRESVEDMFGTDISDDFIQEHLEDIQKLAEGDLTVFDELQKAAAKDYIASVILDDSQAIANANELISYLDTIDLENIDIGTSLDTTAFGSALTQMLYDAGMTADEISNALSTIGFEPEVTYVEVPAGSANYNNQTHTYDYIDPITGQHYTGVLDSSLYSAETGMVKIPVINGSKTSFRGSATGTIKPPKTSGGGGGGGGSKAPERAKYIEDEPDRYHDVNIELAELATAYDRLGKAQEKLTSGDLIDNLNEQLEVLQKQILTYKEKLKLMEEEKSELQGELGAQGVQFSEDGSISNYNDALINRLNQANAEIDRYNQMTAEQQEATKDANGKTLADRATEDYEEFKEALDRYDTLTSEEIPELQDSIQDAIDQQIEIQIQKFNMGIEVQLDMAEATKEFNEWKAKVIDGLKDDDLLGNTKLTMENMQIYFDPSQGEGLMTQTASHLQQVMDEIAVMQSGGTSDIYGDNMAAAMEDLTKYQEELMNQTTEWADYVQEVQDNYLDMIDEANDKIDEQRENYEFINNQLEHSLSIIEKMHGDGAYEEMAQIYELQRQSYEEQLSFQRQEVELWAQRMEEARLSGDTEALEKYTENWKDAQEELDSLVEAALDNLLTEYENAVNLAFDKLNEKVTGGMGLDYVSEEWELANQNAEMYLDTINEAFAIDQLRNKYQKSINETSNLDTQKKLNDLMEKEIAALEKKDKLTQYDVERANMKYDIALKQIALEEAQQNKTTMRLKRDSQGNYTYQYTSDDDAVADAQQQLAEAQNSLYNFDKENYQNNLDQMLSVYTEFQQKMAEAALINDEEQRQARMLMLQEQYGQLINGITAENEVIRYNLHESAFDELATNVYGKNVEEFYNMSQEEQNEIMSGLVPTWEGGVQQMADAFSNGFLPTCQETFNQIDVGYEELKAGMSAVAEQAGIDFQTYADGTQPAIDKMKELVQDNKDVVTEMGNQLSSMQALRDQALEMDDAYAPYLKAVADLVGKSQNLRQAEADVTTELSKQKTTLDDLTVSFTNAIAKLKEYNNTPVQSKNAGSGNEGTSPTGPSGPTYTAPKYEADHFTGDVYNIYKNGSLIAKLGGGKENVRSRYPGILKKGTNQAFNTGGYTGEWAGGSQEENGRLAFLHQKELVLNEQDTANFLTAIQITRGMSGVLESVANKMASIGSTFSSNVANTSNGIQQQITINADFPDATSATEIEEALLSLVNRASQQAFNVNI